MKFLYNFYIPSKIYNIIYRNFVFARIFRGNLEMGNLRPITITGWVKNPKIEGMIPRKKFGHIYKCEALI